jgi:rhomboid protease GluP
VKITWGQYDFDTKMTERNGCFFSITLGIATFVSSTVVSGLVNANPLITVQSSDLMNYGAMNGEHLQFSELWRLLSAQFVHSKFGHMIFNAVMLFFLGSAIEKSVGSLQFLVIWFFSGVLGILASVLFLPQYVSSGASQALMGIAGAGLVLMAREFTFPRWYRVTLLLVLAFQLCLDLIVAHYPKPGHVAGFLLGAVIAFWLSKRPQGRLE